jgi:hypothetical protein
MGSSSQDAKESIPLGKTSSNKRYEELPRYLQWQNAMRPEDTGHSDGAAGIPSASESTSQFEGQVRDYLNSRLARTRNDFAGTDAVFATEIAVLRPDYQHVKQMLDEKRAAMRRPVIVRLNAGAGWISIALATLLSAGLMFVLWHDKGVQPNIAAAISLFAAVLGCLAAYPCGLLLRQGTQDWHKWLAAAVLGVLACVLFATAFNMHTPSFEPMERGILGFMIAFAFLAVAACAFLMHDQDAGYAELERKMQRLLPRLSQVETQRVENQIFHTNVARRHVEIARRMITDYRQANSRGRPVNMPTPSYFNELPQLPEISDNWLVYLETEQS